MKAAVLVIVDYAQDGEASRKGREADLRRWLQSKVGANAASVTVVPPELAAWVYKETEGNMQSARIYPEGK